MRHVSLDREDLESDEGLWIFLVLPGLAVTAILMVLF